MLRFLFSTKKFIEPLTTSVYSTIHVIKENQPIVWVSHELDGDWQFMGSQPIDDYTKVAIVISLQEVIQLDKSVLQVADLPVGYCATRESKKDKWHIAKIEYTDAEIKEFGFYCSSCGIYHKQIPMAYGADVPHQYTLVPENEREKRCILTEDQCVIDSKLHFIRGRVELEVIDSEDDFLWNIWVKVSKQDFERMVEVWEEENRILEKPYSGIIDTHLEPYPETRGLEVAMITQKIGYTPKIELIESNHPLHFEQGAGITMDRVIQFAKEILYNH